MTTSNAPKTRSASAALTQRKRFRRQWITFMRMCRYGINNFSRNAWLTTAAMAVMVVTLLIVFSTVVARDIFSNTISELRQKVDISFYLADDVSDEQRVELTSSLRQQEIVTNVTYVSKEDARQLFAEGSAADLKTLEALQIIGDDNNPFPASLRVNVSDPNRLDELDAVFDSQEFKEAQNPDPNFQPSFRGERRDAIENIGRVASFTEKAGLTLSAIGVIISILIIFNTIRMAIFNRRDEIQMMKLIGADKNFIQGPFIVEAIMYGVFSALATAVIVYPLMLTQAERLQEYGIVVTPTLSFLQTYPSVVLLGLIIVGAVIGVVSSFLAIRRYLKV
jgi:cell division transport system permease protein